MHRAIAVPSSLILLATLAVPAEAFVPDLSPDQVKAAIASGAEQAGSKTHGFEVKEYVLFDRPQPLYISPGDKLVDAVLVGTPRERLLYESYLASFQGTPMTPAQGQAFAHDAAQSIGFRIFAHANSSSDNDRDFLRKFGAAKLELADGKTLEAKPSALFGPSRDFFILTDSKKHEFRWLGALSYVFDLGPLKQAGTDVASLSGTLSFSDSTGQSYHYQVDLSRYQ
jgi:hypothetical protein